MIVEKKIELLKSQMNSAQIPDSRQHKFIEFEQTCGGMIGGYMLNTWIWGLIHERTEWCTPNQIFAKYDESKDLWFLDCFEGHPSDTWSIDEKGGIYWCGSKKSDDYMEIVNAAAIDRNAQIAVLNELDIQSDTRISIAHTMKNFNDIHGLEISDKSREILDSILGDFN
jgi:hypothetical protein